MYYKCLIFSLLFFNHMEYYFKLREHLNSTIYFYCFIAKVSVTGCFLLCLYIHSGGQNEAEVESACGKKAGGRYSV